MNYYKKAKNKTEKDNEVFIKKDTTFEAEKEQLYAKVHELTTENFELKETIKRLDINFRIILDEKNKILELNDRLEKDLKDIIEEK